MSCEARHQHRSVELSFLYSRTIGPMRNSAGLVSCNALLGGTTLAYAADLKFSRMIRG
jgi:hypothetical protein